jgi:succinate-semialdehyde dehydrogenase/glutarate-semialdehyde dehydrogenase
MALDLRLFIAGEWTEGTGEGHYEVKSPVTGEHIYNVPIASRADVDRAVAAAREATEEMRHWTAFERAELCLRIYDLWQERVEEVARILTLEQGKPYAEESLDDIAESADYFQIAAEDVKRLSGEVIPTTERTRRMFTVHRPVGVWAAITPWNFPVMIPMEYVGPGLATGNSMIVKPPEFTAGLLEGQGLRGGGARGAISVIPGDGMIGEALVTHDGVDDRVHRVIGHGRRIVSRWASNAPSWRCLATGPHRHADADISKAAEAAVYGAYFNAGQVCVATERLIVLEEVHDEFVESAMKAAESVRLGDPFDENTNMGPLNNEATAQKMDRHVADAVEKGAEILTGGRRAPGHPTELDYEFTVLARVPEDAMVSQEESFGRCCPSCWRATRDASASPTGRGWVSKPRCSPMT